MLSGRYANAVLIRHSATEFCFDFITNFYPQSAVSARVYIAAPHLGPEARRAIGRQVRAVQRLDEELRQLSGRLALQRSLVRVVVRGKQARIGGSVRQVEHVDGRDAGARRRHQPEQ